MKKVHTHVCSEYRGSQKIKGRARGAGPQPLIIAVYKEIDKRGLHCHFKDEVCEVYYKEKLVLTGRSVGPGGLWVVPINGQEDPVAQASEILQNPPPLAAVTVYTLPYKEQKMRYMQHTFFTVPAQTLEKAIQNDQLRGFPCMNVKDIRRHLAPSPATAKGRMKNLNKGEGARVNNNVRMWK